MTDTVILGSSTSPPPATPHQIPAQIIDWLLSRVLPCLFACHPFLLCKLFVVPDPHPLHCSVAPMPSLSTSQRVQKLDCTLAKAMNLHAYAAGCCRQQTIPMRSGGFPGHASTLQRLLFVPDLQRPLLLCGQMSHHHASWLGSA